MMPREASSPFHEPATRRREQAARKYIVCRFLLRLFVRTDDDISRARPNFHYISHRRRRAAAQPMMIIGSAAECKRPCSSGAAWLARPLLPRQEAQDYRAHDAINARARARAKPLARAKQRQDARCGRPRPMTFRGREVMPIDFEWRLSRPPRQARVGARQRLFFAETYWQIRLSWPWRPGVGYRSGLRRRSGLLQALFIGRPRPKYDDAHFGARESALMRYFRGDAYRFI